MNMQYILISFQFLQQHIIKYVYTCMCLCMNTHTDVHTYSWPHAFMQHRWTKIGIETDLDSDK